ncbi:hypothetical protein L6452_34362 [Arctium lappa]|uniref:Uncharacterized protein n=1 Tax=Arctium lappa TaxID=4217 RepID=A0ACB8YJ02_ARCLA|nr:hypothetical protein L6452_34362 [Arctium lappa]
MSRYHFECFAEQTNDEIPTELVLRLPPNYTIRYFYMRLLVTVEQPLSSPDGPLVILGHQFELLAPHDQAIGVSGLSWNAIIQFFTQNGIPNHVVNEATLRITTCVSQMLQNPNNAGRMLLPMLVLISCRASVLVQRFLATVVVETEGICCICSGRMEVGSPASRLPCNHCYHDGCIREWLNSNPSCPFCGFQLV